jgi:hypothetical protein
VLPCRRELAGHRAQLSPPRALMRGPRETVGPSDRHALGAAGPDLYAAGVVLADPGARLGQRPGVDLLPRLARGVLAGVPAQGDRRAVGGGQLVAGDRNVVRVRLGGVGVKEDALERDAAGGDVPGWRGVLPAGGAKGARASATSGSRVKDMTVLLRTSDVSGMSGMLAGDRGPRDGPAVAGPAVAEVKGSGRSCRPVVLRRLRRGRRPSRSAAAARLAHFDVVQCAQCIRSHGQAGAGFGEVSCALEDEDLPTVRTCHYFCLLVAKRPAPPGSCDCRVQP